MSKTTKTPLRNHQRRPRLQEDFLETHRRLGISQAARAMKIDTHLPGCILDTSSMSKTTKTPLRNHQRPFRLHGWHFDDVLENPGVGPLSRWEDIWKLICSFLNVSLRHLSCQKPPRLLSGTTRVLLDSMEDTLMTLWRTQELDHFPGRKTSENWYVASLMYLWDICHVKNHQDSSQEPPASS